METTQIQVSKEIRKKLRDMKITKRESYDEIIRRIIKTKCN
ncbi:MAG: hypothetical protein U9Q73_00485 [Nanoarchaeota archaeon]|nr:hypothetical protein [Nanoarchaeota archaeon]